MLLKYDDRNIQIQNKLIINKSHCIVGISLDFFCLLMKGNQLVDQGHMVIPKLSNMLVRHKNELNSSINENKLMTN